MLCLGADGSPPGSVLALRSASARAGADQQVDCEAQRRVGGHAGKRVAAALGARDKIGPGQVFVPAAVQHGQPRVRHCNPSILP